MQLKIQRSQRTAITGRVVFCLDVRADYSAEEQSNIRKYKLGSEVVYNSRASKKNLDKAQAGFTDAGDSGGGLGTQFKSLAKGAFSLALAKMQLNVSIASLAKGHHIECKDLEELLDAEDALREASKNLTRYLEIASTFDGSEVVISYEKGEEKVHIAQNMPPLLTGPDTTTTSYDERPPAPAGDSTSFDIAGEIRAIWNDEFYRRMIYIGGGVIAFIIILNLVR